jgi:hypothetical protein
MQTDSTQNARRNFEFTVKIASLPRCFTELLADRLARSNSTFISSLTVALGRCWSWAGE